MVSHCGLWTRFRVMRYYWSSSVLVVRAQILTLQPLLYNRLLVEVYSVLGTFSPTTEVSGYYQRTSPHSVGRRAQETNPRPGWHCNSYLPIAHSVISSIRWQSCVSQHHCHSFSLYFCCRHSRAVRATDGAAGNRTSGDGKRKWRSSRSGGVQQHDN